MSVSSDQDGQTASSVVTPDQALADRLGEDKDHDKDKDLSRVKGVPDASKDQVAKWEGVQLAKEAEKDQDEEEEEDELEDEDLDKDDVRETSPQEERLLEELIRLRLSSQPEATASQLPPKQRIQLYQPRTKLEQLEDILMESQLLEQSGFTKGLEKALATAADTSPSSSILDGLDLELLRQCGSIDSVDFEVSDAIFDENPVLHQGHVQHQHAKPAKGAEKQVCNQEQEEASVDKAEEDKAEGEGGNGDAAEHNAEAQDGGEGASGNGKDHCPCTSCLERQDLEMEQLQEVERLRECWSDLRRDICLVYRMVLDGSWSDPAKERPDLQFAKDRVHKLCWKDAHQLYQRLEAGVKEFVLQIKLNLIELLQKQAKNPSLAQDFIQSKINASN